MTVENIPQMKVSEKIFDKYTVKPVLRGHLLDKEKVSL